MCKYDVEYKKCENLTREQIISEYDLGVREIRIMKYLFNKQYRKDEIIDIFNYEFGISQKEVSKILGSLKKKGLIYSVINMPGWLGTEINITR